MEKKAKQGRHEVGFYLRNAGLRMVRVVLVVVVVVVGLVCRQGQNSFCLLQFHPSSPTQSFLWGGIPCLFIYQPVTSAL